MPKTKTSQITQSELETCFAVHRAANTLAFLLGKKLNQGATVEPGHYTVNTVKPGLPETIERLSGFNTQGVFIETDLPHLEIFTGTET
jgi:hypothetical protein